MNDPATKEAFSTARETANGYVLVSQPVSVDLLEGVFDLEAGTWEFPYGPKCRPGLAEQYGVNDAEKLCKYFSKVYVQETHSFQGLEPNLRNAVVSIGQHYLQHLRYPGTGPTPGSLNADTPANVQRTKKVQQDVIVEIVGEVADQIDQKKKKIEAKGMPKPDPPDSPAKSDPAKLKATTKAPPSCALPTPPKAPPKGFESYATTDTTVKQEQSSSSATDTTVKKAKSSAATDTTVKKESSNKITPPPHRATVPTTPATSSATPIPPAGPPPERIPKPPPYPPRNNVQLDNLFQHHHLHHNESNDFQHHLLHQRENILKVPTLRKSVFLCRDDGVNLNKMMKQCGQILHTILMIPPIWKHMLKF